MSTARKQPEQILSANDSNIDLNNLGIYEYFKAQMMGDSFLQAIKVAIASAHKDSNNRKILTYIASELKKIDDTKKVDELILGILTKRFNELQTKSPSNETTDLLSYIITDLGNSLGYNTRPSSIIAPSPLDVILKTAPEYKMGQKWETELDTLLKRKNLNHDLFKSKNTIKLSDDIAEHVKWAYNNIYSISYPGAAKESHGINRYFHGIQHVTRASLHIPVLINLYRKHGDADALKLTEDDVKLLQLAAVFHDSAREGEGVDYWDHESGMFLYTYLTQTLNIDPTKAKLIAEAIANKDVSPDGYFEIIEDKNEELAWQWNKTKKNQAKNIYQKIVHDADCLEVIRARDVYNATYLDFYKDIASNPHNDQALEEMAHLVTEARSLINIQGDSPGQTKHWIKQKYEHQDAYHSIKNDISPQRHPIMYTLNNLLSPQELKKPLIETTLFDESKGLKEENLRAALREGKIYARGISIVSARNQKHEKESLAALELRKTMRKIGVPTETKKEDRYEKEGNPYRSVSMLGYGSGVFTNAGFLIVDPDIGAISHVSAVDSDTGFGKKSHLKKLAKPSTTEIQTKLTAVHNKLKLGGEVRTFSTGAKGAYVEILYDVKNYQAVFYTNDATFSNTMHYGSAEPTHKYAPLLEAIYLQKQYEIDFEKSKKSYIEHLGEEKGATIHEKRFGRNKTLPIFLYSGTHNEIKQVSDKELTDENIVKMWAEICTDFINDEVKNPFSPYAFKLSKLTPKQVKILAMYKKFSANFINAKEYGSADELYSPELQEKITQAINKIVIPKVDIKALEHKKIDGFPKLIWAVKNSDKDFVKEMIEAKADLDILDMYGNSALTMAATCGFEDIAEMLISAGANIELKNYNQHTPLDKVIRKTIDLRLKGHFLSTINLLLEKNAIIHDPKALKNYLDSLDQNNPNVLICLQILKQQEKSSASTPQLFSKNPATLLYEKKEQETEKNKAPKLSEIIHNTHSVIKMNYKEPLSKSAKTKGRKKWELHAALDKALQTLERIGTEDKANIDDAISAIKEIQNLFAKFVQEVDVANGEKDAEKGVAKEKIDQKFWGVKADTLKIRNDYMAKQGGKQILEQALNELSLMQQEDLSQTKKFNK
jgi:hypothetical protein